MLVNSTKLINSGCVLLFFSVINELDGLKKDFQPDKYDNLQHAQYVLEKARCVCSIISVGPRGLLQKFYRALPYESLEGLILRNGSPRY